MDSDGLIVDKARTPSNIKSEEILTWYKNMLTGTSFRRRVSILQDLCTKWTALGL